MKYAVLSLLFVSLSISSIGQISHGGEPYSWDSKDVLSFEAYQLPDANLSQLQEEDAINDKHKDQPYRFGKNMAVDLDIHNSGIWTELENGDGIWRLALHSEGATSLNFVFDSYLLPEGAKVFVYPEDKSQLLGSFTNENTSKSNSLGVGLILSDNAIIEYHEPANVRGEGYLHINNVTHGYRDILVEVESEAKGAFGNAAACNINVNCPEGIPFDVQKRSVALIVVNNNGICTGAMVNNTSQDGTPFFLTANHCLPNNPSNTQNWIFYFNHETPGCNGNNGPTDESISGGIVLSSNADSDFALLELNQPPPPSYNVCYSGWDATDAQGSVVSAFGIHHPRGDVKKICFDEDAPFHNILPFEGTPTSVWYVNEWELGVTQPGSSGSPLFNQNGLIIGQLAGGTAACDGEINNGGFDYYGRLGVSWSNGNTPSNAIRFWLDLAGSGTLIVPNSCNNDLPDLNASLGVLEGIPKSSCNLSPFSSSVNVLNLGVEIIEEIELEVSLNGNVESVQWSGTIAPSENVSVPLGNFAPSAGINNFTVEILTVNGQEDTDALGNMTSRTFEAFNQAAEISVNIILDNFPNETTWSIVNDANNLIASGGTYSANENPVSEKTCLTNGCYEFIIFDSVGDGICCDFGEGSYSVEDEFGTILASGGDFDSADTTEICVALDIQNVNASLGSISEAPDASCDLSPFEPTIQVLNVGEDTLVSVVLEANLNGNTDIIQWSSVILPDEEATIPLGNFTPSAGVNTLAVEILTLNGQEDTDESGNTSITTFEGFAEAIEISVNISLDSRPNETTWRITNDFSEVVASGGPYSNEDNLITDTICLVDGCYDFTIFDSAGDGICCDSGQGSYSVVDQSGTIWAQGSDFNFLETSQICANLDSLNTPPGQVTLFPNPATNLLKIDAGSNSITQISIYDINGKLISEKKNINSPKTFLNTEALSSGLYLIEVRESNGTISREKFIVTKVK